MSGDETVWLATEEREGQLCFRVGRRGGELVAEWIGIARLTASPDGGRTEIVFEDAVPEAERRKLERGAMMLLVRQLRGELAMHGAAVAFGERAVVLVGASTHGKSTLAAALCARGGRLLADDAVAVDLDDGRADVLTTESDHWLDRAALDALGLASADPSRAKEPVRAASAPPRAAACAVVALVWSDDERAPPRLVREHGVGAVARVLPHVARFVVDSEAHQRAELDRLEALVARVPVYALTRPRAWAALEPTVDMVRDLCLK